MTTTERNDTQVPHLINHRVVRPAGLSSGHRLLPRRTRRVVLAADRYRCVFCGAAQQLEVDHVVPVHYGGRDRWRNFVTLCRLHNRIKGTYYRNASGRVRYRSWPGQTDRALAAAILGAERRALRSPVRWARLALALWGDRA